MRRSPSRYRFWFAAMLAHRGTWYAWIGLIGAFIGVTVGDSLREPSQAPTLAYLTLGGLTPILWVPRFGEARPVPSVEALLRWSGGVGFAVLALPIWAIRDATPAETLWLLLLVLATGWAWAMVAVLGNRASWWSLVAVAIYGLPLLTNGLWEGFERAARVVSPVGAFLSEPPYRGACAVLYGLVGAFAWGVLRRAFGAIPASRVGP